jgi:hypothetical protein
MLRERVAEAGCAIAYVNQVGGQDELVFDGDSLIVAADGTLLASGAQFATDLVVVDIPVAGGPGRPGEPPPQSCPGWWPPSPARARRPGRRPLRPALRPRSPTRPRSMPPSCWGPGTTWARTGSPRR